LRATSGKLLKAKNQNNSLEAKIADLLAADPLHPLKAREIARKIGVSKNDYQVLRTTLRAMSRDGKILRHPKSRFGIPHKAAEAIGQLRVNSQGYGFVTREEGDDIFISQKNMGVALHKDMVRVRLFAATEGKSPEGQIVEVAERARSTIVGVFRRGKRHGYVVPDDIKLHLDLIIDNADTGGAENGQKVVAEIDQWEHVHLNPTGRIVEVLGFPDERGVDVLSVLHNFELPNTFPEAVLAASDKLADQIPQEEISSRLDLRRLTTFTIDPGNAKDFDDAVSLEKLANGNYRLGVHIADVSYYVAEGGIIDKEAIERGTSVYLVDRVVPMLPEKLSNELCSLKEGKNKLCYSVLMELSPTAELISYELRQTIINSKKRLTYEEAQEIIEGKLKSPLSPILQDMYRLSKKMIAKRESRGSIDFETLELEVILDESGHPVQLKKRQRMDSNRLVEEFMLLANETVAHHVGVKMAQQYVTTFPFVYRIHEKPDALSVKELVQLAAAFKIQVKPPQRITPKYFQKLSLEFQQHPATTILEGALLRSMAKARYSTDNVGHFGLAYKHYTHFTSPIRRYPDLIVHRLLKKYGDNDNPAANRPTPKSLEEICKKSTEREIRAQEAERASIKMKQVEYMERHLGETFRGIISRIVPFGIFVELPEFLLDGLVHISDLQDDYYLFDEKQYSLKGRHHGKVYRLGDKLKIKVSRVNRNERLIDFVLA
jgi:ribonuclease R